VLTCVTLVLTALRPGLAVSLVIFSWPALAVRTGSPPVRRSASGVPGKRRVSAFGVTSIWESLAREAVVLAAGAVAEVVPPAAGVAVGGRSVPLQPAQRRGLAQLQVSRIASTSFRVIRPVLFEVLKSS
jgi:hypothetical protein